MKLPILLLALTIIILVLLKDIIMEFLFDENNAVVFIVLILSVVFQVIYRFSLLVIRMKQKGHLYSLMEILNKTFNLLLLIILFYVFGSNYVILIYSAGVTLILITLISLFLERDFWRSSSNRLLNEKHSQKEIFSFSYPLVLTALITWLFQAFDKIAIRYWGSFDELGLYAGAFRIVALLTVVQVAFSTFWSPVCYERFEKLPNDREFFSRTSRIIGLVMFLVASTTILFKDVIVMLLGPEFKEAAVIMPFLIFMPVMYTLSETTVIGINFFKKTKWHILIASMACLFNIVGNFILVPLYGAAGAAVSTGLSYIIFFILRTHLSLRYYSVDYNLKRIYFLILCLSIYGLQSMIWPNGYLVYISGFALILLIIVLHKVEIKLIFKLFLNKRKGM